MTQSAIFHYTGKNAVVQGPTGCVRGFQRVIRIRHLTQTSEILTEVAVIQPLDGDTFVRYSILTQDRPWKVSMEDILEKLKGGDRRSIGRSAEVVQDVLMDPSLFEVVLFGMLHEDPLVRMRAADVVEKVTSQHPGYLQAYKDLLLGEIARIEQQEVRWHVAQILPRLKMNRNETQTAIQILKTYLEDDSRIVRTFAMDSLAYFAEGDPTMEAWVITLIEEMVEDGSPAMQSRGRKLLAHLKGIGMEDQG